MTYATTVNASKSWPRRTSSGRMSIRVNTEMYLTAKTSSVDALSDTSKIYKSTEAPNIKTRHILHPHKPTRCIPVNERSSCMTLNKCFSICSTEFLPAKQDERHPKPGSLAHTLALAEDHQLMLQHVRLLFK